MFHVLNCVAILVVLVLKVCYESASVTSRVLLATWFGVLTTTLFALMRECCADEHIVH